MSLRMRIALLGILALLAALVILLAAQAFLARQAALDLRSDVTALEAALKSGDLPGAQDALDQATDEAERVQTFTTGPHWALAARMPGVGAQVTTARSVAAAVEAVAPAADSLLTWAIPLQASGARAPDGRIDVEALAAAAPQLTDAAAAMRDAERELEPAADDPQIDQARDQLARGARLLDRAASGAQHLPALLGVDGPRTYAVLLQNIAEIRGSGGLVGAYALITADDGRITLDEAAARKDGLDGETIPFEQIADEGEIATWGRDLASWPDYNLSLDFPLTARLTAAGMAARDTPVDGVIALDARVVSGLLAGTGPIEESGARLTRDNAEAFFTRDIYAKVPDVEAKDTLTVRLLQAVLDRSLSGQIDAFALLGALIDPVEQGRLRVWVDDPQVEKWLLTTPFSGALPDEPGPYVGIALNNAAGSKMDAYLDLDVRYRYPTCPTVPAEPNGESTLDVILGNTAPVDLPDYVSIRLDQPDAPTGSTSLLVHVYGPQGASLQRATLDGHGESFTSTEEGGHPVWGFYVELDRGQERRLRLTFSEPVVEGASPVVDLPPLQTDPRAWAHARPCPSSE